LGEHSLKIFWKFLSGEFSFLKCEYGGCIII
jgi:hypothetical protein